MAVNKSKKNIKETSLRTPKPKNKLGLVVPRIGLPHDEFVKADSDKRAEIDFALGMTSQSGQPDVSGMSGLPSESGTSSITSNTGHTAQTSLGSQSILNDPTSLTTLTSPDLNFAATNEPEVIAHVTLDETAIIPDAEDAIADPEPHTLSGHTIPPSLPSMTTADAVPVPKAQFPVQSPYETQPSPLFRGKSKQLYEVLHQLTFGANVPQRSVRIRKGELMKLAGIGSRNTFIANIDHLVKTGLIRQTVYAGEADGNEFELLEVQAQTALSGLTSTTAQTTDFATQDGTSATAVQPLIDTLDAASRELTGSALTNGDLAALRSIAELIINAAAQHPEIGQSKEGMVELAIKQLTNND